MNTKAALKGGGGGASTWDDMFIYGKQAYIESVLPGRTNYFAQLKSQWAWVGNPPRQLDESNHQESFTIVVSEEQQEGSKP